jgi:hypothetical protein
MAADAVHVGLYAFMTIMPASGIAMGYYGGKGLPFFWTTLPGITKTPENKKSTGKIAGQVRPKISFYYSPVTSPVLIFLLFVMFLLELQNSQDTGYLWKIPYSTSCWRRLFTRLEGTVNFFSNSSMGPT